MNLRQKRKHYYHSYKYYLAWWSENRDIYPKSAKKIKKYLKKNYKIRREYDFINVSRNYFYFESYCGEMPKFMREKRKRGIHV